MSNFSKYKIEQVRLIHCAFEKDRDHVASYVTATPYTDPLTACEEVYRLTQNIENSWVEDAKKSIHSDNKGKFTMCPGVETRSTSVGDVMEICYPSESGNGYRTVTYVVADVGFERI
jgi:hypothetical protein